MNTKSKKLFAIVLTLCLLVMSSAAFAATRYAGQDRYQTAVSIVSGGWTTASTAVLATGESSADALCAAPLAKAYGAPIISVDPKGANTDALALLTKLGVKTVFIAGGTGAVPQAIEDAVKAAGMTVTRLAGADRYATSLAIANQLQTKLGTAATTIAVANGEDSSFADALSVSSIAAFKGMPILLTSASALGFTVPSSVTKSYVIGGTGVVSDAVMAQLPGAVRLSGADRYATNVAVLAAFPEFKFDKVFLATGENFPDALAGAALAANTASPVVLVSPAMPAATQTFLAGKVTSATSVVALGGASVVSDEAVAAVNGGAVVTGPVTVTSVTAAAANAIKVVFAAAPADTSKVVFTVTRGTTPATVTATWNAAKTEATLTSSGNFADGDYTVAVKNDTTDLGSNTVTYTSQRIAKIAIDGTVLAVTDSGKTGYVGYHVYDQYGADITTSYLASSSYIQWNCGIGQATSNNKGLLTIAPFSDSTVLTMYTTAVITAVTVNQSIPASVNATLNISTSQGTINDITLNKLTNVDNAVPTVGDSNKYYIDYSAKDMAGNDTKSYTLMKAGLITNNVGGDLKLIASNSQLVDVVLVQDPSDDQKAAIEVTIKDPEDYTLMQDQPITITATTYTGKTSSLTFTVKRKTSLDAFTLMAPTGYIASAETATIPFLAYDQNGAQLTKIGDLKDKVQFNLPKDKLYFEENADGTATLKYVADANNNNTAIQQALTATVIGTGKFSSITVNIDQAVKVNELKIDETVVVSRMEIGAQQNMDFGWNDGGFQLNDQFGRKIDMTTGNTVSGNTYFVAASTSDTDVLTFATNDGKNGRASDTANYAYNGYEVQLVGKAAGSGTVTFKLMKGVPGAATETGISKTMSFSVIDDKDISGYIVDSFANPIYAGCASSATNQQKEYNTFAFEPYVWGTTSSGSKVALNADNIMARTSSSGDFFVAADGTQTKVFANQLADSTKTGSSTTLSITVYNNNDKRPHVATTTVKSITDGPVAQSVGYGAYTVDKQNAATATGITTDGNTITVKLSGTQYAYGTASPNFTFIGAVGGVNNILNGLAGRDLTRFTNDTADAVANKTAALTAGNSDNRGYVYLWAKDQYGSKSMNLSNVMIAECSNDVAEVVNKALVFKKMPVAGDYIMISGISTNGLVNTIKIVFAN